jgi:hypothetical protein
MFAQFASVVCRSSPSSNKQALNILSAVRSQTEDLRWSAEAGPGAANIRQPSETSTMLDSVAL